MVTWGYINAELAEPVSMAEAYAFDEMDEVDALIAEKDAKPGLGVQDSAGLIDYDAEVVELQEDIEDREWWSRGCW